MYSLTMYTLTEKNVTNLYKKFLFGARVNTDAKINLCQYVIFIKPRNFDTANIKCFTVSFHRKSLLLHATHSSIARLRGAFIDSTDSLVSFFLSVTRAIENDLKSEKQRIREHALQVS